MEQVPRVLSGEHALVIRGRMTLCVVNHRGRLSKCRQPLTHALQDFEFNNIKLSNYFVLAGLITNIKFALTLLYVVYFYVLYLLYLKHIKLLNISLLTSLISRIKIATRLLSAISLFPLFVVFYNASRLFKFEYCDAKL